MGPLPLRAALKRGALVAAANWPVVVIDFALESFYALSLTVPVLGGALMVAAIAGTELGTVVGEGLRATADLVVGSLGTAPVALTAFFAAVAIVGVGGETIVFALKVGTLSVIVAGDRAAGEVHTLPIGPESIRRTRRLQPEARVRRRQAIRPPCAASGALGRRHLLRARRTLRGASSATDSRSPPDCGGCRRRPCWRWPSRRRAP